MTRDPYPLTLPMIDVYKERMRTDAFKQSILVCSHGCRRCKEKSHGKTVRLLKSQYQLTDDDYFGVTRAGKPVVPVGEEGDKVLIDDLNAWVKAQNLCGDELVNSAIVYLTGKFFVFKCNKDRVHSLLEAALKHEPVAESVAVTTMVAEDSVSCGSSYAAGEARDVVEYDDDIVMKFLGMELCHDECDLDSPELEDKMFQITNQSLGVSKNRFNRLFPLAMNKIRDEMKIYGEKQIIRRAALDRDHLGRHNRNVNRIDAIDVRTTKVADDVIQNQKENIASFDFLAKVQAESQATASLLSKAHLESQSTMALLAKAHVESQSAMALLAKDTNTAISNLAATTQDSLNKLAESLGGRVANCENSQKSLQEQVSTLKKRLDDAEREKLNAHRRHKAPTVANRLTFVATEYRSALPKPKYVTPRKS